MTSKRELLLLLLLLFLLLLLLLLLLYEICSLWHQDGHSSRALAERIDDMEERLKKLEEDFEGFAERK